MNIDQWQPDFEIHPDEAYETPEGGSPTPDGLGRDPNWVLEELLPSRSWNFVQGGVPLGFHHGSSSRRRNWTLMAWSLFAATVDMLIALSLACLFAAGFISATGLNPHEVSHFFRVSFRPGLVLCFITVFSSYLLFLRVFAGCTLGEWACGIRLGEPRHRISNDYALRVMQRFVIVAFTGGILIPIISLMFGIDLAGRITGLPLVQHYSR